jgi:hypothetical protein
LAIVSFAIDGWARARGNNGIAVSKGFAEAVAARALEAMTVDLGKAAQLERLLSIPPAAEE